MQHAFERGVVHRDIKPSNLLVTTTKVNGELAPLVKILDFGLARFESESDNTARLTQIGNLLGTIDYVAPEQAQNARTADIRADIYSLGCSLFYMLTAQPPFLGNSVVEKLGPRLTGEPPSVRAVRADVPAALDELLRKLMARRPDDRLQTPIEVAQALLAFTVKDAPSPGALVVAQPVSPHGVDAGNVPMAQPIQASSLAESDTVAEIPRPLFRDEVGDAATQADEPAPARIEDPSFSTMTATGRDMSTGATAATPVKRTSSFPVKLSLILGAAALAFFSLLCVGVCFLWPFGDTSGKKITGSIRITNKTKFSMPEKKVKAGERKFVLVFIERIDYKGAVRISLEDLPGGVRSESVLIPAASDREQVPFTVSNDTEPIITPIRVVAESEEKGIRTGRRAEMTLELNVVK